MTNRDDRLEQNLAALEAGVPLHEVVRGLAHADPELASLVHLAAAVRAGPHPEPSPAVARQTRQRAAAARAPNGQVSGQRRPWLLPSLGGVLALALCAVFAFVLGAGARWFSGPAEARFAVLQAVAGQVEVAAAGSQQWRAAAPGERLQAGQRVRTGPASGAALAFFEGSITRLGPATELVLTRVAGRRGGVLQVELTLVAGQTTHAVVPLRGAQADYAVHTPGGTARVRGTTFSVAVSPSGQARFAVETGRVVVTSGQAAAAVLLAAGQATVAEVGQGPAPAAYHFAGQGLLTNQAVTTWDIGGVPVAVTAETTVTGDPRLGDFVQVEGRLLAGGVWHADAIAPALEGPSTYALTGPVEDIAASAWTIAGVSVGVDFDTQITPGLAVGDLAHLTFSAAAGDLIALSIMAVVEDPPTATPSATPDPRARPSLSFEPDELEQAGCAPSYTFAGTLRNTGDEPDDVAANVALAYTLVQGAEYVAAVTLDPAGWSAIAAGQTVDFDVNIALNAAWASAPDGAEVKVRVTIGGETNRPGHHAGRLTVTIIAACAPTATSTATASPTQTPTATLTPTGTVTATLTPTATLTATPAVGGDCTGANPHPHGLTLANRYGVPYAEIMAWFCSGNGFGEIDIAYGLSRQTGVSVQEIFALRHSGLGWGQVRKQLGVSPGGPGGPPHGPPGRP